MHTPAWGEDNLNQSTAARPEPSRLLSVVLCLVAVLTTSTAPQPALAFLEDIAAAQSPLAFPYDGTLADHLIDSLDLPAQDLSPLPVLPAAGLHLHVLATAYNSTPGQTDSNPYTTASGTTVHPGTLAANFLPFGTIVRIGQGQYTVEDRLNPRYNQTPLVDLWFGSQVQARQFGVRRLTMEIISVPEE